MSGKSGPFVTELDLTLSTKLKKDLEEQGFELAKPQYTVFQAKKKGVSCTLYESGKLVVQGKEMKEFIEFYLEPELLKSFHYSNEEVYVERDYTPRIGIDEAGKGDFFGSLCIAGLYASEEDIDRLHKLGIKDSKKINDKKIRIMAKEISKNFQHAIVRIGPTKYNELYSKFRNLNRLLAWGHATAIENLMTKTGCNNVLIDQFGAESLVENALKKKQLSPNLKQRHRAEEDIVVAGASILARAAFLEDIDSLGKSVDCTLPKGAAPQVVRAGQQLVQSYGPEVLDRLGKRHFKTRDDILGLER